MISAQPLPDRYEPIMTTTGTFAMVAVDQRESLRVIMNRRLGQATSDAEMRAFKTAVARALSADASGMLVDPLYGLEAVSAPNVLSPGCGLIVSVDAISYDRNGSAVHSQLDLGYAADQRDQAGAAALKFLLIWSQGDWFGASPEEVRKLIRHCRERGLLSLVETVVREPDGSRPASAGRQAELLLEAAGEIGAFEPDLYKTEVPYWNDAAESDVVACSAELTKRLRCPWVVLSSGVDAAEFPTAVRLACEGGASGFLAGRGIWGPAIGPDIERGLNHFSVGRLRELMGLAEAAVAPRYRATRD